MKLIIGISGKAGHGKDSLADIIQKDINEDEDHNVFFERVRYADKLKDVCADLFDIDQSGQNNLDYKDVPIPHLDNMTPREVWQIFGTEVARNIFDNVWIYHHEKRIIKTLLDNYAHSENVIVFTTDIRFQNEYNSLKNFGKNNSVDIDTCLIRVNRPGFSIVTGKDHSSEDGLDDVIEWDYFIESKNMDSLAIQGETISKMIIKKYL